MSESSHTTRRVIAAAILTLAVCSIGLGEDPPSDVERLQAEVQMLKVALACANARIAELEAQLCEQANQPTDEATPDDQADGPDEVAGDQPEPIEGLTTLLEMIPQELLPAEGDEWSELHAQAVEDWISDDMNGRRVICSGRISLDKTTEKGITVFLYPDQMDVPCSAGPAASKTRFFKLHKITVFFPLAQRDALLAAGDGAQATVIATIDRASIQHGVIRWHRQETTSHASIALHLVDAELQTATPKGDAQ